MNLIKSITFFCLFLIITACSGATVPVYTADDLTSKTITFVADKEYEIVTVVTKDWNPLSRTEFIYEHYLGSQLYWDGHQLNVKHHRSDHLKKTIPKNSIQEINVYN
jgi:hypothetical protein